jgi:predicted AAA+ superfamily ATPase
MGLPQVLPDILYRPAMWRFWSRLRGRDWIEQQWEAARLEAADAGKRGALLVLDEIQKIPSWSETVKRARLESEAASLQYGCELFYWRDRGVEVDFIVRSGHAVTAIEIKSGRTPNARSGLMAFGVVTIAM